MLGGFEIVLLKTQKWGKYRLKSGYSEQNKGPSLWQLKIFLELTSGGVYLEPKSSHGKNFKFLAFAVFELSGGYGFLYASIF